ncbi:MAG: hypothetical protein NC124_18190 [Clostridium sp.]|nr:hypothetical protein [Ruminococcus flavefaciens]MCM1500396.1 hypothetical protein [Clostridium sp.]
MKNSKKIFITIFVTLMFGVLLFPLWIWEGLKEETYHIEEKKLSLSVEMDNENVESIIQVVRDAMQKELQNYFLAEIYIELETKQGIGYIRIAFIKDRAGKEIDAKEIEVYPNANMIDKMTHYVGSGRAYSGVADQLEENEIVDLYAHIWDKVNSEYKEEGYIDKSVSAYLSKFKFEVNVK